MKLDSQFVRAQFPAFSEPTLEGWAFFENAGGSYTCKQVIDRLTSYYTKLKVQPYYPYPTSMEAGKWMDESYERLAAYLNVDKDEIHFGPSTTQNIYVLANALRPMWNTGDEIIVSCQDHEANAGAWRRLENRGIVVKEWHVDKDCGHLHLSQLDELMTAKTKMIAFPHCSNVIAHINPVKEIADKAHGVGAIAVVDGVSYAPHGYPDVRDLGADIYMFSLYKTWGPHLGVMTVKRDLMQKVENQSHFFKNGVSRSMLTPAGPDHAQIAAAKGIAEYFDTLYHHHFGDDSVDLPTKSSLLHDMFRAHEKYLLKPLLEFLKSRDDVRIVGPDDPELRVPTVSIIPLKKNIGDVVAVLTDQKLMVGYGNFYAVRPLMDMDISRESGVLRMSFIHYTTMSEIEHLIAGLKIALDY
ncbi:aminotransferase class V-fold PLP-dependent enzyme [Candidatus Uabimicrobium amorphum]|uniref:Cysteine desulfurase n=1 Tax=Uabimicrobium amorphum TaxID=2596890 RepID=A0A5S9IVE3_UABAM|nr:aminotransferase class V-fold PLP-dependent enzyme [Candidatus Uabimicrobium amorphum]BBM87285.1 cysteine desulfurase [Candidatus Uabimicrobium amorphum]